MLKIQKNLKIQRFPKNNNDFYILFNKNKS